MNSLIVGFLLKNDFFVRQWKTRLCTVSNVSRRNCTFSLASRVLKTSKLTSKMKSWPCCPSSDRRRRRHRHRRGDRDESAHVSAASVVVMTSRVFLSLLYFRFPWRKHCWRIWETSQVWFGLWKRDFEWFYKKLDHFEK